MARFGLSPSIALSFFWIGAYLWRCPRSSWRIYPFGMECLRRCIDDLRCLRRLALHACIHRPDLWQGVVVVGADPGLGSSEEKNQQFTRDRNWADRLKKEPLEQLVREWDEQPVFCGIENSAPRNLEELDPIQLSQQFEVFSKGLQQNLVPALSELKNPPVLFLAGEKDKKYQQIGDELAELCPVVESRWVEDSGHRVPWENPESFSRILIDFAIG